MDDFEKALDKHAADVAVKCTYYRCPICVKNGARWAKAWCLKHTNSLDKFQNFLDTSVQQDEEFDTLQSAHDELLKELEKVKAELERVLKCVNESHPQNFKGWCRDQRDIESLKKERDITLRWAEKLIKAMDKVIRVCDGLGFLRPSEAKHSGGHILPATCEKATEVITEFNQWKEKG